VTARTPRALLLDFNGTLSHDEHLLYEIYAGLFAEQGRPLSPEQYERELAGLAEHELIRRWLGDRDDLAALVAERVQRYCTLAGDGSTIAPAAREAVRLAAAHVTVAVVSGAARVEIEQVLSGAHLTDEISAVVADGDTEHGKPHPDCYLLALDRLGLDPGDAVAVEDTESGIAAARAAGIRVVAVRGTMADDRLAAAEAVVDVLSPALVRSLLGLTD
jgi:beta-phosphoglucomutase